MKAILITACGCRKTMNVERSIAKLYVPIVRNYYSFKVGDVMPRITVRERVFEYYDRTSKGTPVYRERVE